MLSCWKMSFVLQSYIAFYNLGMIFGWLGIMFFVILQTYYNHTSVYLLTRPYLVMILCSAILEILHVGTGMLGPKHKNYLGSITLIIFSRIMVMQVIDPNPALWSRWCPFLIAIMFVCWSIIELVRYMHYFWNITVNTQENVWLRFLLENACYVSQALEWIVCLALAATNSIVNAYPWKKWWTEGISIRPPYPNWIEYTYPLVLMAFFYHYYVVGFIHRLKYVLTQPSGLLIDDSEESGRDANQRDWEDKLLGFDELPLDPQVSLCWILPPYILFVILNISI